MTLRLWPFLLALLLAFGTSFSSAQNADAPSVTLQSPEAVADEAVEAWLATERPDFATLTSLSTVEACQRLPELLASPPPPEGTEVNLAERREVTTDSATLKRFTYPASLPGDILEVVEVDLEQAEGQNGWEVAQVSYQRDASLTGVRAWLQTPLAGWLFVAFSLYILFLLLTPSFFRRWLGAGWDVINEHRRLVIGTMIAFYGLFFLGTVTGANMPEECGTAVLQIVETAISSVGATDAYGSLDVKRAAVVTFYQNFVVVTLSVLFGFGILFGFPAYLFGALSFYAQAIPFGLIGGAGLGQLFFVFILLFLELTSYFLVIAGGGMLLVTLIKEGFRSFGRGVNKLALMLPFALILLLIGAWYEAGIIILPQLLGGP